MVIENRTMVLFGRLYGPRKSLLLSGIIGKMTQNEWFVGQLESQGQLICVHSSIY